MAERLNVILVQRSGLGPTSESMTEAIVGNLAGRPGIDLVLVSPLAEIADDSTDCLTLNSIVADAAVLTWSPAAQTIADLMALGFQGVRAVHAGDSELTNATTAGRKIYAVNLNEVESVDDLIAQMNRIREVKSVRTFSLEGDAATRRQIRPESEANLPNNEAKQVPDADRSQDSDRSLDDLIDQLDQFDS